MLTLKMISWDFKNNPKAFERMILKGPDFWDEILQNNNVQNYVILSTCNRLEFYTTSDIDFKENDGFEDSTLLEGMDAVRHLMRVASGLESMSVGENDILRQLKEAYDLSLKKKKTDKYISLIFRKAISVGKKVREKTEISHGKVSIPALTTDIVEREFGVSGRKVAIIGTGKMAIDMGKYISKLGPLSITVIGRNIEHAVSVAKSLDASYGDLSEIENVISENDIIVTATSSRMVLISQNLMGSIKSPKYFLDISNPKNIDCPEKCPENVIVKTLSDVQPVLENNRKSKEKEIAKAEEILSQELHTFGLKLREMKAESVISEFYKFSGKVKEDEIKELKRILNNGGNIDSALEAMVNSLINKILSPPTFALKKLVKSENEELFNSLIESYRKALTSKTRASSQKSGDRQEIQNQQGQIPRLNQKP